MPNQSIDINTHSLADYELFLKIKALPRFSFTGRTAEVPEEYAKSLGIKPPRKQRTKLYVPSPFLYDYQADCSRMAIDKKKFGGFIRVGLGKTLLLGEFMKYVLSIMPKGRCALIISPLMVIKQTMDEFSKFYGNSLPVEQVRAHELGSWICDKDSRIGITNYEAITELIAYTSRRSRLFAIGLDEASLLKSHYGKWGTRIIDMGKGLDWKLSLTGTPAPNDRIEYANQAVFLDQYPNVNSFLSRFFVNRGQTDNRWELRPHALKAFYKSLSHWSIFLNNPATYGWKDNIAAIPPVNVHIHDVDLTQHQRDSAIEGTGALFPMAGGIVSRGKLAQIAKGRHKGQDIETYKPQFVRDLVATWPNESTIIWCKYNPEQERIAAEFPGCANLSGDTPESQREQMIEDFKAGRRKQLVTKSKIAGFGLNLQVCTRMVFSTCQDSYEEWAQCIGRANRVGSTMPLNAHIPLTEIERPMFETVLRKCKDIEEDTRQQEAIFRECQLMIGASNV